MEYNTSNTINYKTSVSGCPYRLPCGYCEKLCRDCPKVFYSGHLDIAGTQPYPGATYATTTATNTNGQLDINGTQANQDAIYSKTTIATKLKG